MIRTALIPILPALLASIRQQALDGKMVLEQLEGNRSLVWRQGCLVHLQSDAAGEQFGSYLLRKGVLNLMAHSEFLANGEPQDLEDKVVQWGIMTLQERDAHQAALQEAILVCALEQPILHANWTPGAPAPETLLKAPPRTFLWNAFHEAHNLSAVRDLLLDEADWKWEGPSALLETLADLPLTPATAFALTFLGTEPISFETFLALGQLPEEEAGRLLITLWALGALTLTQGNLPVVQSGSPALRSPEEPAGPPAPETSSLRAADSRGAGAPPAGPPQGDEAPPASLPREAAEKLRKCLNHARKLLLQERVGEAIRTLEQAIQLGTEDDSSYECLLLLGKLRMGNPAWSTRSIDALQAASRLRPKAAEPWADMGEIYYRKGFKTNAMGCFQRALELDPSVPIPADIDLQEVTAPALDSPEESLLSRIKSLWNRTDKP